MGRVGKGILSTITSAQYKSRASYMIALRRKTRQAVHQLLRYNINAIMVNIIIIWPSYIKTQPSYVGDRRQTSRKKAISPTPHHTSLGPSVTKPSVTTSRLRFLLPQATILSYPLAVSQPITAAYNSTLLPKVKPHQSHLP